MRHEDSQTPEVIKYPRVGDIVRILPGQIKSPEGEEYVVLEVHKGHFGAGELRRLEDGALELDGGGTFHFPELGEVIGHLGEEEILEGLFKWVERFGGADEKMKKKWRKRIENAIANQYPGGNP